MEHICVHNPQMKDLKRQLQQMPKREEKLQEQLTALRGGNAGTLWVGQSMVDPMF